MNQKEHIKNLMSQFLKNAQETIAPDPKKNFLVLDNLIAKLKKDLSTTSNVVFTAAKDTELFLQDLTNSSNFIKYLYNNKIALDGKQLVLDHNATGVEKFIDLDYSQLSPEVKKLYFPFPELSQDYWVYKEGIEKFLQSKAEEAEKSTDPGFKNILKTLLKKLSDEINSLAPSLKVTHEKGSDIVDQIPKVLTIGIADASGTIPLSLKDLQSVDSLTKYFKLYDISLTMDGGQISAVNKTLDAVKVLQQRAQYKKGKSYIDNASATEIDLADNYLRKTNDLIAQLQSTKTTEPTTSKDKVTSNGKSIANSEFAQWLVNPGRLPLYKEGVTLSRINAFAEAYMKTLGTDPDANVSAKMQGVSNVLTQIMASISAIRQIDSDSDTLMLNLAVPARNIGSRSTA